MLHEVGSSLPSDPDERVGSNRDVSSWRASASPQLFRAVRCPTGRRQRRGCVTGRRM